MSTPAQLVETAVEVMPSTTLEALTRGEIDVQIATAKKYRRSVTKFMADARSMVSLNPEIAAACFYILSRKEAGGGQKKIEGPSVRLAEIAASCWGNLRAGSRVIDEADTYVEAQGFCHDLEQNVARTSVVRRRIVDRNGRRYSVDMILMTANAACAIAERNAVIKVVPRAYVEQLFQLAKKTAVGDAKTLSERRDSAIKHFEEQGIAKADIFRKLEKKGVEDITLEDLELLHGLATAIRDGDTTAAEAFAAPAEETPAADKPADRAEALAQELGKDKGKKTATAPERAVGEEG